MKVGLIGCGRAAMGHLLVYDSLKETEVSALSEIDVEKGRKIAQQYRIGEYFQDYSQLLEKEDLDFVDICTPTSTHSQIVNDAARYGHDILVEKPMALTSAECEVMIREAKRNGVRLCICHNQIFAPPLRKAKQLVDSGYYDLVSFRTTIKENLGAIGAPKWCTTPKERGVLWETGCHAAYLQLHFLPEIERVYATGVNTMYSSDDVFSVLLGSGKESFGSIEVSWIAEEPEILYEIDCSDGKRAQIDLKYNYLYEKSSKEQGDIRELIMDGLLRDTKRILGKRLHYGLGLLSHRRLYPRLSHLNLICEFIESVKNDKPVPVPPEQGKRAIRLLESIAESMKNRQVVEL